MPISRFAMQVTAGVLRQCVGRFRAIIGQSLQSERGATLVETAFVLPMVLSIVFGLVEFSLLAVNAIAVTNNVQAAAHFAATSPRAWSAANPITDTTRIQGWVKPATGSLPNNDAHIVITYIASSTGQTCGKYSQATNAFVPVAPATVNTCVVKNNLIKVQANYTYTFVSFPFVTLFPHGVGIHPSAVILEES